MTDKQENEHTPTPWRTGFTLRTALTRQWPAKMWAENDAEEGRRVFANFTEEDQGRSRIFVCFCERKEDADFIIEAVNSHEALVTGIQAAMIHSDNKKLKQLLTNILIKAERNRYISSGELGESIHY